MTQEIFVDELGLKEAWVEVNNNGDYTDFAKWEETGVSYWGNWDSVERVFYKDGNGIHLEPTECSYISYKDSDGNSLSDHNGCFVEFTYTLGESFEPESADSFTVPSVNAFSEFIRKIVQFIAALSTCLANLDELMEIIG